MTQHYDLRDKACRVPSSDFMSGTALGSGDALSGHSSRTQNNPPAVHQMQAQGDRFASASKQVFGCLARPHHWESVTQKANTTIHLVLTSKQLNYSVHLAQLLVFARVM